MAKLYGKGTVTEIVKGKKYRLALSAGKDPLSGRVYESGGKVPDNAFALDDAGNPVKPRTLYGDATDEQRAAYSRWKTPVKYLKAQETFLGTKRQAELRIEEMRRELEHGKAPNADKITFAEWLDKYLALREGSGKYRPKTLKQDRSIGKHLLQHLGGVLVVDIAPAMVDDLYSTLRESGVGDTTVKQCHKLLKRVMDYAVRNDLISTNPVDKTDAPRKPRPQRNALDAKDAKRLSGICESGMPTANKTATYLGLSLGARLGEVLGLTWGHVELDGKRPFAHIAQQQTAEGKRAPLKTDKDDNPVGRIVPLDASTVAVLKAWKAEQLGLLNELGIEQGNDTPIITNQYGEFASHSQFGKWWRSFCVDNGFGRWVDDGGNQIVTLALGDDAAQHEGCVILWRDAQGWPCDEDGKRFSRSYKRPAVNRHYKGLRFHELRHTHFTMRLADGMDIPTAQALGGWSTPDVLLNVYAHPVTQNIWDSAGFMDRLTATRKTA